MSELSEVSDRDLYLSKEKKFRETAFIDFKKKYGIPAETTMEKLFAEVPNTYDAFEDFVSEKHEDVEDDVDEYIGTDDLDSDEY